MAWLQQWLTEIILIILLATFTELLLPNNSLQRYTRTVIGLFLLLVLLSPVMRLFASDWQADRLLEKAEMAMADRTGSALPSLQQVNEQSAKLQAEQRRQTLQLFERRVAASMKDGLVRNQVPVQSVRVEGSLAEGKEPAIVSVTVELGAEPLAATQKASAIKPIEPVRIQLDPIDKSDKQSQAVNGSASAEASGLPKEAESYLVREWGLASKQIHVVISEERG